MTTEQVTQGNGGARSQHNYQLSLITLDSLETRDQPRTDWDSDDAKEALEGLTESIKQYGVLQPILVAKDPKTGKPFVVAGGRRIRAMKASGAIAAPALVVDIKDEADILQMQLQENVQRRDLSPVEEGDGYVRLIELRGYSMSKTARMLKIPLERIERFVRIARDPELRTAVDRHLISTRTAVDLDGLHESFQAPLRARLRAGSAVYNRDVVEARQQQQMVGEVSPKLRFAGFLAPDLSEKRRQAVNLRESGSQFNDIARKLGCSQTRARGYYREGLRELGRLPSYSGEAGAWHTAAKVLHDNGVPHERIATELGLSQSRVSNFLRSEEGRRPVEPHEREAFEAEQAALDAADAADGDSPDEPQGGIVYTFDDRDHIVRETQDAPAPEPKPQQANPAPIIDMSAPPTDTVTREERPERTPNAARSLLPMRGSWSPQASPARVPSRDPLIERLRSIVGTDVMGDECYGKVYAAVRVGVDAGQAMPTFVHAIEAARRLTS